VHALDREQAEVFLADLDRQVSRSAFLVGQDHEEARRIRADRNRVRAALARGDEKITVTDDGSVPYDREA